MEKQMNIPQLRFPEFKGEWEKKKLGEICKMQAGKFINAADIKDEDVENKYPCYGGNGLRGYTKTFNQDGKFSLIGRQGAHCGNVNLATGKFYATEHAVVVNLFNGFDTDFIYFILGNLNLNQYSTGLAQPGLSVQNIEKVETYLAKSLPEQTKIATFLTAVDEKIQALKKKHSLLEQYKKGVMQKLFSQALRFKDQNGNDFPDWEVKKLGEVFYSEKGKGISKNKIVENGKYECILYGELYTKYNEVIFDVVSKTNEEDGIKSQKGDLLIPSSTTTTGIDLANVTALNKYDVLLGGDITVLRSNEKINNVFYAYYLSNHKKDEIASYAQGSTIVHLYYSHIKDMFIDIPCLAEQTAIANFLSALDEKINQTQRQIEKTEAWKKGLLQKMFV